MASSGRPQYYILEGVRRALAARDAGLLDIPAQIQIQGQSDVWTRVDLDQLHSPKRFILRDFRYIRDTEYRTAVLKTQPPAILLEPLGSPGQTGSVPLSQVIVR
jgi:hypothetical protein